MKRSGKIREIRQLATKQKPLTAIEEEFILRHSYENGCIVVRNPDAEAMQLIKAVTAKGYKVFIINRHIISNSIEYKQYLKNKAYGNAT